MKLVTTFRGKKNFVHSQNKKKMKITHLEKVRFIKVNELTLTQVTFIFFILKSDEYKLKFEKLRFF